MADLSCDIKLPEKKNEPSSSSFLVEKHALYLKGWGENKKEYEYVLSEYLRMSGLYWCLTALDILHHPEYVNRDEILDFVSKCRHSNGGYAPCPGHDPHLLYTLSAIQVLTIYDAIDPALVDATVGYVKGLQKEDGSFAGDKWGEIDTRFSFCAIACLSLLNRLHVINVEAAAKFILKSMNFDGGFGTNPGSETHAGQIYCCVSALAILNRLDAIDSDALAWWLCERQLPSGGLNGRPEKLPDVCYSWWVLSSLKTLGRLHWISKERLLEFVLACQDEETGGFADRPGDLPDPFHTLFGSAALSLLGDPAVKPINPIYCMPEDVIDRVFMFR